jgi:hypothetical protein
VRKPVEGVERFRRPVIEDPLRARDPVLEFSADQVPDDVARPPTAIHIGRGGPGFGHAHEERAQDLGCPLQDVARVVQERVHRARW